MQNNGGSASAHMYFKRNLYTIRAGGSSDALITYGWFEHSEDNSVLISLLIH